MEKLNIDYRELGQNIRAARLARKLTQKQVCAQVGIGVSYYSHIESGDVNVGLATLIKLSDVLAVTVDSLLYGSTTSHAVFDDALRRKTEGYSNEERTLVLEILDAYNKMKSDKT